MRRIALGGIWVGLLVCTGVLIGLGHSEVALLAMALFGAGLVMLRSPGIAILAYVASRPLVDVAVFQPVGPFTLGQLWGGGLIALMGWYWIRALGERASLSSLAMPLWVVGVYAVLSLGRGDDVAAVSGMLKLAAWTLLVPTVWHIARTSSAGSSGVLRAGTWAAIASLAAIAASLMLNRYGAAYYAGQSLGVGQGPHGIASTAVMCVPLLLVRLEGAPRRWPLLLIIGLLGVGVLLSLVRTAVVAYMIVIVGYAFWLVRKRGWVGVVAATVSGLAAGLIAYAMQDALLGRLGDLRFLSQGGTAAYWAGGGRIGIWVAVLSAATSNWSRFLFGSGPGASLAVSRFAMGASVWAHNDFLELLLSGGVLLLASYVAAIGWVALPLLRRGANLHESASLVKWIGVGALTAFVFTAFFNGMFLYQASVIAALFFGYAKAVLTSGEAEHESGRL